MTAPLSPRRRAAARWLRAPRPDAGAVQALQRALNLPEALCALLVARGMASVDDARRYIREGHFAPGSMLPKVEAAVEFAASRPGRRTLITLLGKAREGIEGRTGTLIG